MKAGKRAEYAILILLILALVIIAYLTSLSLNAFNEKFHKKEFKKYNIYGEFPDKDIDKVNSGLLLYLKDKKDDFDKGLFNEEEVAHLGDVKLLAQKINVFYYSVLIVFILLMITLFLLNKKGFLKNMAFVLFFSGLSVLLLGIVLLVLIKLNFDGFFTAFHNIFFPQGGWLFEASDNIIRIYPPEFFYDMAKNIFISVLLYGNILIGAGVLLFARK